MIEGRKRRYWGTNFHSLWIPRDMKSFMVSYEAAILLKTPATGAIRFCKCLRKYVEIYLFVPSAPRQRSRTQNVLFFHGLGVVSVELIFESSRKIVVLTENSGNEALQTV